MEWPPTCLPSQETILEYFGFLPRARLSYRWDGFWIPETFFDPKVLGKYAKVHLTIWPQDLNVQLNLLRSTPKWVPQPRRSPRRARKCWIRWHPFVLEVSSLPGKRKKSHLCQLYLDLFTLPCATVNFLPFLWNVITRTLDHYHQYIAPQSAFCFFTRPILRNVTTRTLYHIYQCYHKSHYSH